MLTHLMKSSTANTRFAAGPAMLGLFPVGLLAISPPVSNRSGTAKKKQAPPVPLALVPWSVTVPGVPVLPAVQLLRPHVPFRAGFELPVMITLNGELPAHDQF